MQKTNNIKTAVYNKLNGDSTLSALITGIFGKKVKPGTALPYIRYFVIIATPEDTFSTDMDRYLIQIDCYAEDTTTNLGEQLVGEIASAVDGALDDQTLTITDYESVYCQRTATRDLSDLEDGKISRINLDFIAMVRAT